MILLFPSLIEFQSKEEKERFDPSCHMFYSQRVVDIKDGLPKWSGMQVSNSLALVIIPGGCGDEPGVERVGIKVKKLFACRLWFAADFDVQVSYSVEFGADTLGLGKERID